MSGSCRVGCATVVNFSLRLLPLLLVVSSWLPRNAAFAQDSPGQAMDLPDDSHAPAGFFGDPVPFAPLTTPFPPLTPYVRAPASMNRDQLRLKKFAHPRAIFYTQDCLAI